MFYDLAFILWEDLLGFFNWTLLYEEFIGINYESLKFDTFSFLSTYLFSKGHYHYPQGNQTKQKYKII